MRLCIVGWYGTETLGDRGILDGIFLIFKKLFSDFEVKIGSLYPFFTERTIFEDQAVLKVSCPLSKITIFDVKSNELYQAIRDSDVVVMGGGPLMDLDELAIILKAFRLAKAKKKKTLLFGCGVGPLVKPQNIKLLGKIIKLSDACIFRDKNAVVFCEKMFGANDKYTFLCDPAIISACNYQEHHKTDLNSGVAVNLREFPLEYGVNKGLKTDKIKELLLTLAEMNGMVKLVPMHTFFIGGDDRSFFNVVCKGIELENIEIINKPLNLYETYQLYASAKACVGMRYHSVIFQTILNGNNYILDYTKPEDGKISGFLQSLPTDFYDDRYFNLQTNEIMPVDNIIRKLAKGENYCYREDMDGMIEDYQKILSTIIN